jgi:GNAT superfamily N-acetyltransferase
VLSSSVKLSLVSFGDGVRRAYARLFAGDPDKAPEMLDWRFSQNPHGPAKFAVAKDGGEVAGMIGLVPTRLRAGRSEVLGYQAIDTMVDPAYRGQGLFVKLGELAQDASQLGGEVLWGLPNASAAPGWYGRLGWRNLGQVPLLIRPLRTGFVLGRLYRSLRAFDLPLIGKAHDQFELIGEAGLADVDALWSSVTPDLGTSVDRSGRWLQWRLFDKPGADYRVAGACGSSHLEAIVVTRVADKHGARLCYVMDAVSEPGRAGLLSTVLRSELADAASRGAEAALAWCAPHAPSYPAYRKAGFLSFPPRLRPIEINLGARALNAEGTSALASPWTISLLDSDGFRRTVRPLAARSVAGLGGSVAR